VAHLIEIGDFLYKLGIFLSAVIGLVGLWRAHGNAKNLAELTANTNSIKDALVRVTGESEHAKGVIAGKAEQKKTDQG
jgi:hypothetical protein